MNTDQCRHMRSLLGMRALGRLDPDEAVALQAHLDGCAHCRQELSELREVGRALGQADPGRIDEGPARPPATLHAAVFGAVDEERRKRRRQRTIMLLATTTAATAAAVIAVFTVVIGGGFGSPQTPTPQSVAFVAQPNGVHATASVENRNFGTSVALDVTGLADGQRYAVWLEQPDGNRMAAGSFIARGEKKMSMQLAVGLPMSEASALGVSTPTDETPILLAPLHT